MNPLTGYLLLSALLFSIGLAGALTRRNAILVLIGIELMLNAANLNFIAFWRHGPNPDAAAGVMFVGISNVLSKWGTTDIPTEEYNVHARRYPWEEYEQTLQRSPVYWADRANTPLLILHGDADPRVSPTQSAELYRHIRVRRPDTPVRLVWYPDEGHGNAMAAARYDYNLRMMEWFDTYLKTGDRDAPMPAPRPDLGLGD